MTVVGLNPLDKRWKSLSRQFLSPPGPLAALAALAPLASFTRLRGGFYRRKGYTTIVIWLLNHGLIQRQGGGLISVLLRSE